MTPEKRAERYWAGGKMGKRRCDQYPFDIEELIIAAWLAGFRAKPQQASGGAVE